MCAPCELLTTLSPLKYCSDLVCLINTGTPYTQQSYKVSESFPYKWINKKWKEGFHVTSMATAGNRWGVIMSRNAGYSTQVHISTCIYQFFFRAVFTVYSSLFFNTSYGTVIVFFMNYVVSHVLYFPSLFTI